MCRKGAQHKVRALILSTQAYQLHVDGGVFFQRFRIVVFDLPFDLNRPRLPISPHTS